MKTQKRVLKMLLLVRKQLLLRQKAFAVMTVTCLVLISFGCKKNQDAMSVQTDYSRIVTDWYRSFSATASEKERKSAEGFIKQLDYSEATQIQRENKPTLSLIRIAGEKNAFFAIAGSGDTQSFDGIYISKDLANIRQVITTSTLPADNRVIVYNLNRRPARGWSSNASGKMHENLSMARNGSNAVSKVSTSSVRMSDWEDCDYVFWIEWEVSTLKLVSATYLYNTCDDNQPTIPFIDPGPSVPGMIMGGEPIAANEVDEYNQWLKIYNDEVNGAAAQDHEEDEGFSTSVDPTDLLTKNWSADWICLKGDGAEWQLRSYEVGKLRACNLTGHPWAFKSIAHHSIAFEGQMPSGTDISFTQGVGTPSFTEENAAIMYYLAALMQLKFNVTYKFVPPITGIFERLNRLIHPPETKAYEARGAWKLS